MNDNLSGFTDEELKEELVRRAAEKSTPRPMPKTSPDFLPLVAWLEQGMQSIQERETYPKDFKEYVFESAMTCIYGPEVFAWINKRCKD